MIQEKIEEVRRRIEAAARAAGRDPAEVTLLAATKGVPAERIREAAAAGLREIGENRVQEARAKRVALAGVPLRWHLIGHLQRNKGAQAAELFDVIHSVDTPVLAAALERGVMLRPFDKLRAQHERGLEVLIQVNVSGESTKRGCRPEEAEALAEAVLAAPHLRLAGLMTMAPFSEDPEGSRPHFRRLRELRDEVEKQLGDGFVGPGGPPRNDEGHRLHLSMGMSGDFEVAVQEGATIVRLGTALFGEREE